MRCRICNVGLDDFDFYDFQLDVVSQFEQNLFSMPDEIRLESCVHHINDDDLCDECVGVVNKLIDEYEWVG